MEAGVLLKLPKAFSVPDEFEGLGVMESLVGVVRVVFELLTLLFVKLHLSVDLCLVWFWLLLCPCSPMFTLNVEIVVLALGKLKFKRLFDDEKLFALDVLELLL